MFLKTALKYFDHKYHSQC